MKDRIDILEVKKAILFIKKHVIKLQLKLEIQREATNTNLLLLYNMTARVVIRMFEVNRKFRIRSVL